MDESVGAHSGDAPLLAEDLAGRLPEPNLSAEPRDGVDERIDQRFGAALDMAELLLHQRSA